MRLTKVGLLSCVALALMTMACAVPGPGAPPGIPQEPPDPPAGDPGGDPPADEPAMRVTPTTGLRDGEAVQVELTGFTDHLVFVVLCPASIQDGGIEPTEVVFCGGNPRTVNVTTSPFVVEGGVWIYEWLPIGRPHHCAARPGACVVVAAGRHTDGAFHTAVVPVEVVSSPLTVRPTEAVAGTTVEAHVGGEPGAEVTVAQCVRPVGESSSGSRCGPGRTLVLDEHGVATADVVLARTVETPAGALGCLGTKCAIATFDAAGRNLAVQDVIVRSPDPIQVTLVSPSDPWSLASLVDGQEIEVAVTGRPEIPLTVAQCDAAIPWYSNVEDGPCQVLAELAPVAPGTERPVHVAVDRQFTLADGTVVDCTSGSSVLGCSLVVEGDDGGEWRGYWTSFRHEE
jgi:hypothetical protein